MRPDPEMITVLIDTAKSLKGSQKRLLMARTVKAAAQAASRTRASAPAEDELRTASLRLHGTPSVRCGAQTGTRPRSGSNGE